MGGLFFCNSPVISRKLEGRSDHRSTGIIRLVGGCQFRCRPKRVRYRRHPGLALPWRHPCTSTVPTDAFELVDHRSKLHLVSDRILRRQSSCFRSHLERVSHIRSGTGCGPSELRCNITAITPEAVTGYSRRWSHRLRCTWRKDCYPCGRHFFTGTCIELCFKYGRRCLSCLSGLVCHETSLCDHSNRRRSPARY